MKIQPSHGVTRNKRTTVYALIGASMLVAMLAAQLFAYEDFAVVLSAIMPESDTRLHTVMASCIVFAELFALPYLLGMYLSKLMRLVSALLGFFIAGFWLFASLTNAHAGNSGLFSATFDVPGGLIAATWSIVLFGLICKVLFADSRFRHAHLLR